MTKHATRLVLTVGLVALGPASAGALEHTIYLISQTSLGQSAEGRSEGPAVDFVEDTTKAIVAFVETATISNSNSNSPETAAHCAAGTFTPPDICCRTKVINGSFGPAAIFDLSALVPPFHVEFQ